MGYIGEELNTSFKNEQQKAILNILFTANRISSFQNEFFKTYGLSPQQYNILRILKGAKKPLKVQTIKVRMIDRSPNVTRLTDKLIEKGLIERLNCPTDRRVVHIQITPQGVNLIKEIPIKQIEEQFNNLTNEEASQLSVLLDKLRKNKL